MSVAAALAAIAAAALGLALLRLAWARRGGGWLAAAGWLALAAGAPAWRAAGPAWDKAVACAALVPSLVALVALALGAELKRPRNGVGRKPARERACAEPAPAPRRSVLLRFVLAGPAAGVAAVALAAVLALRAPWGEADRLVTAGFLFPVGWAAGAIWATTDTRLGRVAAGLSAIAAAGLAGAWL